MHSGRLSEVDGNVEVNLREISQLNTRKRPAKWNEIGERRNEIDNNDDMHLNKSQTAICRNITAQCIAMIISVTLMITYGISIGYSTILIPELYKNNTDVVVTLDELTWISSMNYFAIPFGAFVTGPLVDRLGRKALMLIGSVIYVIAWIMFYGWSSSAWALLVGFALSGLAGGITDPTCQIYTSEVTDIRLRGTLSTSLTVSIMLGIFLQIFINTYLNWRTLGLINAVFPTVAVISAFLIPESPHWLASKGRTKDAERSLIWLRGWTDSNSVRAEYNAVIEFASAGKENTNSWSCQLIQQLYFRRVVLLPFALLSFGFFLSSFNGSVSILSYSELVFEKLESPVDEHTATLILAILQVIAPALLMVMVHRTGKRKPTLASLIITSICFLVVTIYSFLRGRQIISQDISHSWIPTTLVLVAIFVSSCGIKCTPWFIAGEMFPVEVRGVAVGILASITSITAAVASKTFIYKLEAFTVPGTFLFFAVFNLIGFFVMYWAMPETEGKTFAEIESYFAAKELPVSEKFVYYNHGVDVR